MRSGSLSQTAVRVVFVGGDLVVKKLNHRSDHEYAKRREALKWKAKRLGLVCWLCGYGFNFDLDWRDPMAFTADHVEPIATGGSMLGELRPAHRSCNSRRGAGRAPRVTSRPVTARQW